MSDNKAGAFRLLGHLNPAGLYPMRVMPVGTLDGKTCIHVPINHRLDHSLFDFDGDYTRHDAATERGLTGFDYKRHGLFAFEENDVVACDMREEPDFYRALLGDPDFCPDRPFLRFGLASITQDKKLIVAEARNAESAVSKDYPGHRLAIAYQDANGKLVSRWPDEDGPGIPLFFELVPLGRRNY